MEEVASALEKVMAAAEDFCRVEGGGEGGRDLDAAMEEEGHPGESAVKLPEGSTNERGESAGGSKPAGSG